MFCSTAAIAAALLIVFANISAALTQQLPAVSGPNGKVEFSAGALTLSGSTGFMAHAAGTLTLPIGDRFGIQADVSAATAPGFNVGAALHVFTRDPASYLIGGTLGMVRTPGALVLSAGPEAELYLDRWTLEAWGGVAMVIPSAPVPSRVGPFVMADLDYYLDEDWRLIAGVSSLDSHAAVHVGTEYMFADTPLSVIADAHLGQDGSVLATIGLRAYIGAPSKSLLRRHREDDPSDRGTQLYNAVGGATLAGAAAPIPLSADDPASLTQPAPEPPASAPEPPVSSSVPIEPSSSSSGEPTLPSSASEQDPSASSASEPLPPQECPAGMWGTYPDCQPIDGDGPSSADDPSSSDESSEEYPSPVCPPGSFWNYDTLECQDGGNLD